MKQRITFWGDAPFLPGVEQRFRWPPRNPAPMPIDGWSETSPGRVLVLRVAPARVDRRSPVSLGRKTLGRAHVKSLRGTFGEPQVNPNGDSMANATGSLSTPPALLASDALPDEPSPIGKFLPAYGLQDLVRSNPKPPSEDQNQIPWCCNHP